MDSRSLNYYKEATRDLCVQKGWDSSSVEQVWMLFSEEVGELASAIRQHLSLFKNRFKRRRGVDVEAEMADVLSYLFQLADKLDIDMDAMWDKHLAKMSHKHQAYSKKVTEEKDIKTSVSLDINGPKSD